MSRKVVVCGAGFLGSNIARTILNSTHQTQRQVQLLSRRPDRVHQSLSQSLTADAAKRLLPPRAVDILDTETLRTACEGADVVVSLVGIMHGTSADFDRVQWHGAESVAKVADAIQAKLIHFSAIGANPESQIPYARTKGLGERAAFNQCPSATVIRPSIVFGPGDSFFARFSKLAQYLPFMPVFGGGRTLFQPVYVGDIARAVEVVSRNDATVRELVDGKIIEAGGPDVMTYREVMELVLRYSGRWRPIISLPYAVGTMQGFVLEKLPANLFTLTRSQVEQLKEDNIVDPTPSSDRVSFKELLEKYDSCSLTSVHEILPTYL